MKKTVFTAIFLSTSILGIYGQVETRFFPNRDALQQNRLLKEHRGVAKIKAMPPLDVQKIASARQQKRDNNVPFRFGEGFDTCITLADGEWTDTENGRLWTMAIESKGAYSINFVFNDFYLPEGAELYISNEEGDMLYGPVTSKVNTENGHFLTDLIKGDKVSIYLFEPSNKRNESQLTIKRVVHAYENMFSDMAYGQIGSSGSCNNNVACFPAWSKESDAVALVLLSNGAELCSGSLLMTANQSFRPYFLSAFHCIDTDFPKGSLSSSEISNAENWMFKFQYKMSSCSGGYATSGVTYNRATFRAAWNNTDFALMELRNSPAGDPRFSWLGWDRSGNTPTSGTGIHHPAGDVMKISFDNDQLQTSSWGGNNNHWLLSFDDGVVQHASSGSPLFNQNKRVVGQLHGNQSYNSSLPYCEQPRAEYGQFHRSWTGGGTNSTRLSNWLDPNGSGVMTTNTSKYPTLSGPTSICNQETYTIENLPPGATVNWILMGSLSMVQNNGSSIVVAATGSSTISRVCATISVGSNQINLMKRVNTGINISISGPNVVKCNKTGTWALSIVSCPPVEDITYKWTFENQANGQFFNMYGQTASIHPSCTNMSMYQSNGSQVDEAIRIPPGLPSNTYNITLKVTTESNLSYYAYKDNVVVYGYMNWLLPDATGSDNLIHIYPNPANGIVTIALTEDVNKTTSQTTGKSASYTIQLWNSFGLVKSTQTDLTEYQLSLHGIPGGFYYVIVIKDGRVYRKQLTVK